MDKNFEIKTRDTLKCFVFGFVHSTRERVLWRDDEQAISLTKTCDDKLSLASKILIILWWYSSYVEIKISLCSYNIQIVVTFKEIDQHVSLETFLNKIGRTEVEYHLPLMLFICFENVLVFILPHRLIFLI